MSPVVVERLADLGPAPSVVTIGAFDGVHRGHQHLLQLARKSADRLGARVVAITFEPLPGQVFSPDKFVGRITTNARRRELLAQYGTDAIVELQFSRAMAQETAGEFVDELKSTGPIREIWVGNDFALGHNREGTPARLQELLADHGTVVHAIERIRWDQHEVSSSVIREFVRLGAAREASNLLGHRFEVAGVVVEGGKVGRQIGFPTANVAPPAEIVPLRDGIYATYARIEGETLDRPAMTYIGTRPAVNTGERMIETHLLDFDGDLYGKVLTTSFVTHLRPDSDFPSLDQLIEQLKHDEAATRQVLASVD
ncbi:MAG: riboflavin biosynthesis protein RibF [Thermomicrobiales bacterium]|nr:riboflavin biosynthesis protein RibF [Thermomicrobiales bacterium]